jgi:glycerophosphoryl diester phosphodiesterase
MRGVRLKWLVPTLLLASFAVSGPADAGVASEWMQRRVLNISHQGGEIEAPSNTMFAFKTSVAKGADVLELDVHATSDRELVVIHDATVDRTTGGTGRIDAMTLDEIHALDASYWFVPGCGTCADEAESRYAYRGFATGDRVIPKSLRRFAPADFGIPTLRAVLEAFPNMLINIEIKATAPDTQPYEQELANLLAEFGRGSDTIVVSFLDHAVEAFKAFNSDVDTAAGTGQTGLFWATTQGPLPGAPNPRHQALQVPIVFEGVTVVTPEFVEKAHANDLAVHVWTIDDVETMEWLIEIGVDGIMTNRPRLLEAVLARTGVRYSPTS